MSETTPVYRVDKPGDELHDLKNANCMLQFDHPDYIAPKPDDIKLLRSSMGWSQNDIARMVGVNYSASKGSTTVRKWCSPVDSKEHRVIPYSAWRLLLIYAELVSAKWSRADTAAS